MAGWSFTEVGISVNDVDRKLKEQIMDCLGFLKIYGDTFNDSRCGAAGYESSPLFDERKDKIEGDMIFGEHPYDYDIPKGLDNIFKLMNLLFPKTYLYCEHYSGSSVSGERSLEEHLYNPETMTLIKSASGEDYDDRGVPDYCDGYYRVFIEEDDDYLEYSVEEFNELKEERLKKFIEEEENSEDFDPDDFDPDDIMVDDLFEDGYSYEWDGYEDVNIESLFPDKEFIRSIIEKSTEKGYTELTALLLDKCKDILTSDDPLEDISFDENDDE